MGMNTYKLKIHNKIGIFLLAAVLLISINFIASLGSSQISAQSYKLLFVIILLPSGLILSLSRLFSKKEGILTGITVFIVTIALFDLFYVYVVPLIPNIQSYDFRLAHFSTLRLIVEVVFWQPFLPAPSSFVNMLITVLYFFTGVALFLFKGKAKKFAAAFLYYYLLISILWLLITTYSFIINSQVLTKPAFLSSSLFGFVYYLKSVIFYFLLVILLKKSSTESLGRN